MILLEGKFVIALLYLVCHWWWWKKRSLRLPRSRRRRQQREAAEIFLFINFPRINFTWAQVKYLFRVINEKLKNFFAWRSIHHEHRGSEAKQSRRRLASLFGRRTMDLVIELLRCIIGNLQIGRQPSRTKRYRRPGELAVIQFHHQIFTDEMQNQDFRYWMWRCRFSPKQNTSSAV